MDASLTDVTETGCVACHGTGSGRIRSDFEAATRADDNGLHSHTSGTDRVLEAGTGDLEVACLACHTPTTDASVIAFDSVPPVISVLTSSAELPIQPGVPLVSQRNGGGADAEWSWSSDERWGHECGQFDADELVKLGDPW